MAVNPPREVDFSTLGHYLRLSCAGLSEQPVLLHVLAFWLDRRGAKTKERWDRWRRDCKENGWEVQHPADGRTRRDKWWRNLGWELRCGPWEGNRPGAPQKKRRKGP